MYQLITTKGRKCADTLTTLSAWYAVMQPSSARIVSGDLEAEVDEHLDPSMEGNDVDDGEYEASVANAMRWALRLEEAAALDLTVNNDNIYITNMNAGPLVYLRRDVDCVTLVDDRAMVSRELGDAETLADMLTAIQRGE